MAFLKFVSGLHVGELVEITEDVTVIGRHPDCDIVLDSNGISRQHAEIRRVGAVYYLADKKSKNKTIVNNGDVKPGQDHPLKPGDRINICDVEFIYHSVPPTKESKSKSRDNEMLVTETAIPDDPNMHTLDASRSSTLASAVRPEVKLKAILDIARNLSTELRIDKVAPKILDSLAELFPQAERLFLVLVDPQTDRLVRKAFKYRPNRKSNFNGAVPEDEIPMSISRSIVDHVLGKKKAILSQDAGNDKNLPTSASIADLKIRSVMCVPLVTPDGKALGILQLDTSDRKQFQQDDLDVLAAVASQAAIVVQNAAMHESLLQRERTQCDLMHAQQVQKLFLPQSLPKVPGYEFFAHYHPAYEVGGDFYDFITLPNNRIAIALGDVSGKGVAAALMMAKFSGNTRYCILTENNPGPAAGELNAMLYEAGIEDKFITMCLSVLEVEKKELTIASAGHLAVLVRRGNGEVEEIGEDVTGFPLGIMPDSQYREVSAKLNNGDVVVIYSDGVTDARSPREELYDTREVRRLVKRVAQASGTPSSVGRAILQDIREFSAGHPQADDITLICFGPVESSQPS